MLLDRPELRAEKKEICPHADSVQRTVYLRFCWLESFSVTYWHLRFNMAGQDKKGSKKARGSKAGATPVISKLFTPKPEPDLENQQVTGIRIEN